MSAAIAVTAALLVTGVFVPAEQAQALTVTGQPGTPQAPTPVFTEDFSARDASAAAIDIVNYQGTPGTVYSPGVSGASSETYTADPQWQGQGNRCNGWIVNSSTPAPPGWQCAGVGITGIHQMAQYIGDYQGMSATAAARNQALTAYTADPTGAGVQMQTVAPMPATAGHFYQVSAVFGETNCAAQFTQASERFALLVDGTLNVVGSNLNPCTDPSRKQYPNGPAGPTFVSTLQSAPLKITSAGSPTIGLQLYNAQGSGSGNDVVFDLPQIFDVTPQLDKAFSPSTIASGQTSTLTFTITNTTELAAKNGWSFLDNLPDGITATGVNGTTCSGATVTAPAGSASVQVGGNLNQGQNSCTVTVQVTATIPGTYINGPGNFPDGTAGLDGLNPPADTPLTVSPPASLNLTKSSTTTAITRVGQVVTYKFAVVNRSSVTVHDLVVTDTQTAPASQANLTPILCETTTLAPQDSTTCTARYTVTQADLDHGSLNDTATASAVDPGGATVTAPPASLGIGTSRPAIAIEKTSSTTLVNAVGQSVPYAFRVTNTGNTTLSGISVTDAVDAPSDPAALTPVTCPGDTLIPGAAMDCTATYTVTQADIDHGSVGDRADAAGADPRGSVVTAPPSALLIGVDQRPAVTLVKSAALSGSSSDSLVPGETVQYTFVVTNTGNTTLTALLVDETVFTGSGPAPTVTCPSEPLLPGQQAICTSSPYTILTADAQRGTVDNTAEATLTTPDGSTIASPPSSFSVPFIPAPSLALEKSADPTTITTAGETVDYTFLVTNTGNVPLGNLAVDEVAFSGTGPTPDVACPSVTLVPGQQATCTATYQPTQPDVDAGVVVNTAQANGTTADFTHAFVSSNESSAVVTMDDIAGLTLEKTVTPATVHSAGETVVYHYLLTNEGNTTLTDPVVTETAFTGTGTLPPPVCPATIAPLTTGECTVGYTVTQADVDAGTVTNTAVAAAVTASGATVDAAPASAVLTAPRDDGLTLVKSVSRSGDTAQFAYRVSNTGNTTIHDIAIAETAFSGTGPVPSPSCPATTLAPGESVTCTAVYVLTAADLAAGTLTNTATAGGTGPDGATVGSPSSTAGLAMEHASVSGSALADTGSMRPTEPALLAGALLLLGLLVLVRHRRRHA